MKRNLKLDLTDLTIKNEQNLKSILSVMAYENEMKTLLLKMNRNCDEFWSDLTTKNEKKFSLVLSDFVSNISCL